MLQLDTNAQRLLSLLVRKLPTVTPGRPRTYISYGDAIRQLGLSPRGRTVGAALEAQGLGALADWTVARRLPGITGIIVDRQTMLPGGGYYAAYGQKRDDFEWWTQQIVASKKQDWAPFLASTTTFKVALDISEPPARLKTTVLRIVRDSVLASRVKAIHGYRCQICGERIELSNGSFYAEAHHIRPLGSPHDGPDIEENILCLCPNHHVEMDYAVRRLSLTEIEIVPGHEVDQQYVDYHNELHDRARLPTTHTG